MLVTGNQAQDKACSQVCNPTKQGENKHKYNQGSQATKNSKEGDNTKSRASA